MDTSSIGQPEVAPVIPRFDSELVGYGSAAGQVHPLVREAVISKILNVSKDLPKEDRAIFLAIADHESGFNPSAKNPTSSAHGIFQIINKTWQGLGKQSSQRGSAQAQIEAGIKLFKENLRYLRNEGNGSLHGEERAIALYKMHHDGPSDIDQGGTAIAEKHVIPKFKYYLQLLGR